MKDTEKAQSVGVRRMGELWGPSKASCRKSGISGTRACLSLEHEAIVRFGHSNC